MTFHTVIEDVPTTQQIKIFSPLLGRVNVIAYGSNQLRKKLNHIPHLDIPYSRVTQPLIKGRGYKHRSEMNQGKKVNKRRERDASSARG